jgi:hypothetical protein
MTTDGIGEKNHEKGREEERGERPLEIPDAVDEKRCDYLLEVGE